MIAAEWQPDLWAYIAGAIEGQKCFANRIGGVSDHIHILFEQHRTVALSKFVGEIKSETSKWIKRQKGVGNFTWQAGYGAFSVSASNIEEVKLYIDHQESHHKTKTFQDEFRAFLSKYKVDYDERYVWD